MKTLLLTLALLLAGCSSSVVTVNAPPLSSNHTIEDLSGDYAFVGIIRRRMWQRDVPASIFESFPKWREFPEGSPIERFELRVPDSDTIVLSAGRDGTERRRIFKRGVDFQLEGATPIFAIADFRVEPEGAVGQGSGYARLFRTAEGALAVRFDITFRMRAALVMPYVDEEQAWAIFSRREPNQSSTAQRP